MSEPDSKPVVLLVDDEPLPLSLIARALQATCDVYTAASAEEAALHVAAQPFDVIVCDHMMTGEQGISFLMRMMEKHPGTRRILMTGYTSPEFIARSTALAGLSACLVKPMKASEVAQVIHNVLASPA
ncbi:MAG TPA: response regulator [Opitutaceae bacterium]|jgi:response regulator RpfG family c-di-GMP phosphodiesterase